MRELTKLPEVTEFWRSFVTEETIALISDVLAIGVINDISVTTDNLSPASNNTLRIDPQEIITTVHFRLNRTLLFTEFSMNRIVVWSMSAIKDVRWDPTGHEVRKKSCLNSTFTVEYWL